jgi:hypothetical protein
MEVFEEVATGKKWREAWKYDEKYRRILSIPPSAITGHDEALSDLLGWTGDNAQFVADNAGKIEVTQYYDVHDPAQGKILDQVAQRGIKCGDFGTLIPQSQMTYFEKVDANGAKVWLPASETRFENTGGTGPLTTI